nr:unnamed protein product [Naegleria fowleri]
MHNSSSSNNIIANLSIPTISNLSVCFKLCCNHHHQNDNNTQFNSEHLKNQDVTKKNLLFVQPNDDESIRKKETSSSYPQQQPHLPPDLAECIANCSQKRNQTFSLFLGLSDETIGK